MKVLLVMICLALFFHLPAPVSSETQTSATAPSWLFYFKDSKDFSPSLSKLPVINETIFPLATEENSTWAYAKINSIYKKNRYWLEVSTTANEHAYPSLYHILDFQDEYHFILQYHNLERTDIIKDATDTYVRYHAPRHSLKPILRYSPWKLNNDSRLMGDFPFLHLHYAGYITPKKQDSFVLGSHWYLLHSKKKSFQLLSYLPFSLPPYTTDRSNQIYYQDEFQRLCCYDSSSRQIQWRALLPDRWKRPSKLKDWKAYFTLLQPYFTRDWLVFRADTHIGIFSMKDGSLLAEISLNELHPDKALAILPPVLFADTLYFFYSTQKAGRLNIKDMHLLSIHGNEHPVIRAFPLDAPFSAHMDALAFIPGLEGFWIKASALDGVRQVIYYDQP